MMVLSVLSLIIQQVGVVPCNLGGVPKISKPLFKCWMVD